MNIAKWFAFTRELEAQRSELKSRVKELEEERKLLVDAALEAARRPPVYHKPEYRPESKAPSIAWGPTAIEAKHALEVQEHAEQIFANAEKARNGQPLIPEIPS